MPRNRRQDLPAGWRQPPETTAEPVPLPRPYAPQDTAPKPSPLAGMRPSWRRSGPHRRPTIPGPGGPGRPGGPGGTVRGAGSNGSAGPAGPPPVGSVRMPPVPQPPLRRLTQFPPPLPPKPPRRAPASPPSQASQQASAPLPPQAHRLLPSMRRWRPMRAVIGDGIRTPSLWCESGNCIARFACTDALGERDLRTRALAAGWRYDTLGNLACPTCAHGSTL